MDILVHTFRDYRGIKKRLSAIRSSQQGTSLHVSANDHASDEIQSLADGPHLSNAGSDGLQQSDDLGLQRLSSHQREGERDGPNLIGRAQSIAVGKGTKTTNFTTTRGKSYGSTSTFVLHSG